ncbi:maleylpyruvate isomerase family mycothiol-dependent enzyme [Streptomyces lincolnensis]|uniref:maleylpyruvate isomerase family mycothiol-dependent enzyme n=1 Tax=Streptomyces lincolnensis TaxID=1915 RepID=UPI001E393FD4|nr:maleylpyruvate isomerase family mycothiol-dependent enzyme [Streptomyces lincolnensis]MCD7437915.1 maleylpyruvate isomerase family mycothiol-dependent enzyme [Streptomyces lincolnensis]
MTEHDDVRDLLAAWAFGALDPSEDKTVRRHLAECETCGTEAESLKRTISLLDGPPSTTAPSAPAPEDGVLSAARRTRRPATPHVAAHATPYAAAVAGLRALLPEAEARWSTPVVHDWDVHATLAHLLAADEPLAARLGIAPRVPPSRTAAPTPPAPWQEAWNRRTAHVIDHEYGRTPQESAADWSAQADELLATDEARDPERAARAAELMGMRLPIADHFLVRAFETWIHTDDIGRALGLSVPPPPEAHLRQLIRLAVRVLGLALGPTAPPVLFEVTGGDRWVLGSDAEPVRAELALEPVDFCLLVGGRYPPDEIPRSASGDEDAVRNVLERAASLSWL